MEVQQADALIEPGLGEALYHRQQLRSGQPELGLLAAGVGPLAGSQGRQAHAQTHLRRDLQLGGFFDHQFDFGLFLDDDENVVAELLTHQAPDE